MSIRIDEFGHIIRDDNRQHNELNRPDTNTEAMVHSDVREDIDVSNVEHDFYLETSMPWYGRDSVFWLFAMVFAFIVAYVASVKLVPLVFDAKGPASDFAESVMVFVCTIAPYAVFIGSVLATVVYILKGTKHGINYHQSHEYIIAPLCSVGGAVGTGVVLYILMFAVFIALIALGVAVLIGIGAAIFGN